MKFIIKKNSLRPKIVFIDGLTRVGKSLFSGIIPSFKNIEHTDFVTDFELLMSSYQCKKIKFDCLRAHIHKYFLEKAYNKLISRSVNFKPNDQTGIENYAFKEITKKRLKKKEGDDILKALSKSKNSYLYQTHDMMLHGNSLTKLDLNLKIIEIYRNPFDLVYGWIKKDLMNRFINDERLWGYPIIKFNNGFEGIWYHKFVKKYFKIWSKLNNAEKTGLMVLEMIKKSINNQSIIEKKIKILTLNYEEIIYDENIVKKLEKFLKTKHSKFTKDFFKKMDIPRKSIEKEQIFKKKYLKNNVNNKIFNELTNLEDKYKRNVYGLK